jgi:hypothetical protein
MGSVCGYIRDVFTIPHDIPYLNCLVVNARSGFPTEIETGDNAEEAKRKFQNMSQAVYAYENWRDLLKKYSDITI